MKTQVQLLGFLVVLFCGSTQAFAQTPAHYYPVRPPISPYFAYSAINTTGLPNYYTYIRPAQQQAQYAMMAEQANRMSAATRVVLTEQSVGEMVQRQLMERQTTGYGAPAVAATFQDLSHFYPTTSQARLPVR
jgi:hypothetical protein